MGSIKGPTGELNGGSLSSGRGTQADPEREREQWGAGGRKGRSEVEHQGGATEGQAAFLKGTGVSHFSSFCLPDGLHSGNKTGGSVKPPFLTGPCVVSGIGNFQGCGRVLLPGPVE